jgi:hypothetical protein
MAAKVALKIRQAQPKDFDELKGLVDASFPRFFRFFALHSLRDKQGETLIGEADQKTVGFAKLIWFTIKGEQYGCIL